MINYIWGLFLLIGIVYSFFTNNTLNINQQIKNQGHSSDNPNQQGDNAVPIQQTETQTNACLNVDDVKVATANNVDPRSETRGLKSNRKVMRNSFI